MSGSEGSRATKAKNNKDPDFKRIQAFLGIGAPEKRTYGSD